MKQYYTPEIEDIRVGYECEFTPSSESKDGGKNWIIHWKSVVVDSKNIQYLFGANAFDQVRVPYLTKEQIEAEGWILKTKSIDLWFESDIEKANSLQDFYKYKCYKLFLNYGIHDHKLKIKGDFTGGCNFEKSDTLFEGFCPSINEYRTICKLLNIK